MGSRRRFYIDDPIYGQGFDLIVGGGLDAFDQFIRRTCRDPQYAHTGSDNPDGHTVVWLSPEGQQGHFMYLREWRDTPDHYGLLVHEALHYVQHVMQITGILDHEAHAYFLSYVVRTVLRRFAAGRKRAR